MGSWTSDVSWKKLKFCRLGDDEILRISVGLAVFTPTVYTCTPRAFSVLAVWYCRLVLRFAGSDVTSTTTFGTRGRSPRKETNWLLMTSCNAPEMSATSFCAARAGAKVEIWLIALRRVVVSWRK